MADNKSCEVIGGGRRRGKTTALIMRASREQLYILCPNRDMAKLISNRADELGVDIPNPITIDDLPLKSPYINRVLIDEVEMVLQQLIGKRVVGMSTSYKLRDMPMINNKEPKRPEQPKSVTSKSVGSLHVDIDCSDALTGLKAIQREARKGTQSLKEFEQAYNDTKSIADECNVSTRELLAVLAKGRGELHE